ncbi:hypothetical protein GC207_06395 [bacterium]|nr:hypothetical protein [bacterium]
MNSQQTALLVSLLVVSNLAASPAKAADLTITTHETGKPAPMPARIHLAGPDGKPVKSANGLPFWNDHVSSMGEARFDVAPGSYSVIIERGPEWSSESSTVDILPNQKSDEVSISLTHLADLPAEGWWPGETHIHRPIEQAEVLMRAEDLHFGQFITWWNKRNPWTNNLPSSLVKRFDGNRFASILGGEDERDGGALMFFNLDLPIDITAGEEFYPSSLVYARQVKQAGGWIDIEKPFWWAVPMWIANGIGDSIGIANNHMYRTGVYPNEAWGRPRDLKKYPGPQGNGFWTQDIYYHLLNCGIRIPPSAGAASGVLPNPVGYNRVYVQIDGEPDVEKWFAGLKAGRVFVSNGPLLRVKANREWPGHVFKSPGKSLEVELSGKLDSRDPIDRIELVHNGRVERIQFPGSVTLRESGWFLVRAITTLTNTLRFASTGPFYVELDGGRLAPEQAQSAQFFVQWCDERMANLQTNKTLNARQQEEVLQPWREAKAFWQTKADEAIPNGSQARPQASNADRVFWLNDMRAHGFTKDEMRQVTGFDETRLDAELARLPATNATKNGALQILPYPGGRHPRLGFFEGALHPQRDTKFSIFTPWDSTSYVVVDLPEAIWSNLGLTYLAHTHIDTLWTKQGITLPQLEWTRHADGSLSNERTLPNGISFGATVVPHHGSVEMELWLKNATQKKLTNLRIQNCIMLKGAPNFAALSNENKVLEKPFAAVHSDDGRHWIITAWESCDRVWVNPVVPCFHSDPKFPDLDPGETARLKGWLWFYEGTNVEKEMASLKSNVLASR